MSVSEAGNTHDKRQPEPPSGGEGPCPVLSSGATAVETHLNLRQAIDKHVALQLGQAAILASGFAPLSYGELQHQLDQIVITNRDPAGGKQQVKTIGLR